MNTSRWIATSIILVVFVSCYLVVHLIRTNNNGTQTDHRSTGTEQQKFVAPADDALFEVAKPVYRPGEPFDVLVRVPFDESIDNNQKASMGRLHIMSDRQSVSNKFFLDGQCDNQSMQVSIPVIAPEKPGTYRFRVDWLDKKISSRMFFNVR